MSNDDLTRDIENQGDAKTTQPTITAIFRLLESVKYQVDTINARLDGIDSRLDGIDSRLDGIDSRLDGIDSRLDGIDSRLDGIDSRLDKLTARGDEVESRLAHDIESLNIRVVEGFRDLSNKIDALNRSRLQTEADYFGLLQRVTQLETKAS